MSVSGENLLSAHWMKDVDRLCRRKRFGHWVVDKGESTSIWKTVSTWAILSRVFRIFGLDELVDLKVAE